MQRRAHWDNVYSTRKHDEVGWFRPHLETSLQWIEDIGLAPDAPIIDVGGGASTLVDDLLDAGHTALTVVDISGKALAGVQERLGSRSDLVTWLVADITEAQLQRRSFRLWHDRAVFHFLVDAGDRRKYRDDLEAALVTGGHLVIGTFTPEAPPRCSGLPVQRYDLDALIAELGPGFELVRHRQEMHVTPGGVEQMYLFGHFRRTAD